MKKINLGCGEFKLEGFTNVDIDPNAKPDVVSDAIEYLTSLPKGTVDQIYAGHFIEHLTYKECGALFAQVSRVLKWGAEFAVTVPDVEKSIIEYKGRRMGEEGIDAHVFGGDGFMAHKSVWFGERMIRYAHMFQLSIGVHMDHPCITAKDPGQITYSLRKITK